VSVHLVGAAERLEEGRKAVSGHRRYEQGDRHGGSNQEPADLRERQEMLASPGKDGDQDEGHQERPREVEFKRGPQEKAHKEKAQEEEARSRRYEVCREGRHELEETDEEEAAQEEKVGWVVDVGGEIEGPGTREEPSIGDPGGDQGKAPRKVVAEEDEPREG